jgi:hypothetical protein
MTLQKQRIKTDKGILLAVQRLVKVQLLPLGPIG